MKRLSLASYTKGWFVGEFEPTIIKTNDVEVAVKVYQQGDAEELHHHKVAREITVVVSGKIRMNGQIFKAGDIVVIEPGESTDFYAIEDSVNTVVKIPGAQNDKYLGRS